MGRIHNILKLFYDQDYRFLILSGRGFYKNMPDEKYLQRFYKANMHEPLDLENPKTFNQKLQWLKLNDREPRYHAMVDKIDAKQYVAERLGQEYIIPTIGVWDSFEQIDINQLPEQFVMKCSHDSGGLVICKDKKQLDFNDVQAKMEKYLHRNFYHYSREWPYKGLKPRILVEKYMCDSENDKENLTDYKIFCFNGVPKYVMTVRDRSKGKGQSLHRWYDTKWNLQDLDLDYRNEVKIPEKRPEQLDEMLKIASILSNGMKHLRVDLYLINGQIYFGEMTFYHMSGVERFEPKEWDLKLGELINLDE